jgi:hypothetical protein
LSCTAKVVVNKMPSDLKVNNDASVILNKIRINNSKKTPTGRHMWSIMTEKINYLCIGAMFDNYLSHVRQNKVSINAKGSCKWMHSWMW